MSSYTRNELIKFTKTSYTVAKRSLPPYSSRFSNHRYTQHQHIVLLSLMKRLRLTYREVVEVVALMPEMQDILGLEMIPHFTTLQKFFHRVRSAVFDVLLRRTAGLFEGGEEWHVGRHRRHGALVMVCEHVLCTEGRSTETAAEALHEKPDRSGDGKPGQVIIAHRVARGLRLDAKDAISLIRKTKAIHPIGYSMDKAYDSERGDPEGGARGSASNVHDSLKRGAKSGVEYIGLPHVRHSMRGSTTGGTSLRRCSPWRSGFLVM